MEREGERSPDHHRPTDVPSAPRTASTRRAPAPGQAPDRVAVDPTLVQRVIDGLDVSPPVGRLRVDGSVGKIRRIGDPDIVKGDSAPMENKDFKGAPSASDLEKWKAVWNNFPDGLGDEAKLDELVNRFRANPVGFKYQGASRPFSLAGDCGSLVRTFKAIAEFQLGVNGVAVRHYNGGKAWYLPAGFHEIDPARDPNVSDGGYLFGASHVWAEWSGTVYDVLFGEKGQHGREVDAYQSFPGPEGKPVRHYRVGAQWFKSDGETNRYIAVPDPTVLPAAR